jgi:transmembrane sensor
MNSLRDAKTAPSAAVRAEAAVWVARLHGANRTREVEAGFRQWLSEDPERGVAFELLTDTWEKSARLRRRPSEVIARLERPGFRLSFSRAGLAAVAIAVVAAIGTAFYLHTDGVATGIGEQRTLALEDGTRVYLNTNSRVVVHYEKVARRVELAKGEALFEVAKHPTWPFIVTAGDRQIRALGTAFVVRRDPDQLAVTLVEGKVTVSSAIGESNARERSTRSRSSDGSRGGRGAFSPPLQVTAQRGSPSTGTSEHGTQTNPSGQSDADKDGANTTAIYTLAPGQRLTFDNSRSPQLDQPSIERVTAWQRGQVAFDNTPLVDAVAEMNRYNTTQLTVDDAGAGPIRVSGIFRAGDSDNFAQAVAKTYGLEVTYGSAEIIIKTAAPSSVKSN